VDRILANLEIVKWEVLVEMSCDDPVLTNYKKHPVCIILLFKFQLIRAAEINV